MRAKAAWIRYYFHLDPDAMDDDQFIERWCELEYCLRKLKMIE